VDWRVHVTAACHVTRTSNYIHLAAWRLLLFVQIQVYFDVFSCAVRFGQHRTLHFFLEYFVFPILRSRRIPKSSYKFRNLKRNWFYCSSSSVFVAGFLNLRERCSHPLSCNPFKYRPPSRTGIGIENMYQKRKFGVWLGSEMYWILNGNVE